MNPEPPVTKTVATGGWYAPQAPASRRSTSSRSPIRARPLDRSAQGLAASSHGRRGHHAFSDGSQFERLPERKSLSRAKSVAAIVQNRNHLKRDIPRRLVGRALTA